MDSTYPEREEAIEVARGLHGEKQYDGVRVNRDSYDGNSGSSRETIVYDSTKQVKAAPIPTATNEAAPVAAAAPPAAAKPAARAGSKDTTVAVKASLFLVLILAGGLGLLYGIDYLSAWFSRLF